MSSTAKDDELREARKRPLPQGAARAPSRARSRRRKGARSRPRPRSIRKALHLARVHAARVGAHVDEGVAARRPRARHARARRLRRDRDRPRIDPHRAAEGRRRARLLQRLPAPRQSAAPAGAGSGDSFKCQYHHWEYELDGSFKRIPDLDTFPQGAPPCRGLTELRCAAWGGFVWFSLDPNGAPLRDFLDPIPEHLDPYHFQQMALTRDITVEWNCNWKTSVDAFNESYHVQGIHPQLLWYLHDLDIQIDCLRAAQPLPDPLRHAVARACARRPRFRSRSR